MKAALEALASSVLDRAEADRARAILLTLAGWTSGRIAEAFAFANGADRAAISSAAGFVGSQGARRSGSGAAQAVGRASVAGPLISAGRRSAQLDPGPPGRGDRQPRRRDDLKIAAVESSAPRRGFRFRRPRQHAQRASGRRRRRPRRPAAQTGARRRPRLATSSFCSPTRAKLSPILISPAHGPDAARIRAAPAPGQAKKVAMMGSLDFGKAQLFVTTSRTKRSADFIDHLRLLLPLRPEARRALQAGRSRARQRPDPCQQSHAGRDARRARPLARRRSGGCPRAPSQPESTSKSSGATSKLAISPPDLHRSRRPRPDDRPRRLRPPTSSAAAFRWPPNELLKLLRLLEASHVAYRGHDGERHHHVDPWDCQ